MIAKRMTGAAVCHFSRNERSRRNQVIVVYRHPCIYTYIILYTRGAPQTNNYVSNIIRINYYRVQKGDFRITPVFKIIIIIIYAHIIASVRGSYNIPSPTPKTRVPIYNAHTYIAVHVDELIVLDSYT